MFLNTTEFFDYALSAVRFSVGKQNKEGSWPYGEDKTQRWIDNFHTGYNLVALNKFCQYTKNGGFVGKLKKGFKFYITHLFTPDGLPKYYHNRSYPIDTHCIAQSIITLTELSTLDRNAVTLAEGICKWALENMQSKKSFFYYEKRRG